MGYNILDDYNYHYRNMVYLLMYCGLDADLIDQYSIDDILSKDDIVNYNQILSSGESNQLELSVMAEVNLKEDSIRRVFYHYKLLKAMLENG